jgi:hypothetical protein
VPARERPEPEDTGERADKEPDNEDDHDGEDDVLERWADRVGPLLGAVGDDPTEG